MATKTAPNSPDALEEWMSKPRNIRASIEEGTFNGIIKQYARNCVASDPDLAEAVRVQVRDGLSELYSEAGMDVPAETARLHPGVKPVYDVKAPGAAADGIFGSFSSFARNIALQNKKLPYANTTTVADGKKFTQYQRVQNSFGTVAPADGGFLVPELFRSELLRLTLAKSIVRPRATVVPMKSFRLGWPMVDTTSNASSLFGGLTASWTEEGAAITESQATFGKVFLDAKKLAALGYIPNELMQDADLLEIFLMRALPEVISWYEDIAFLQGSGVGEPLGWLNTATKAGNNAFVTQTAVAGQGTGTVVWENVIGMYARMLPQCIDNAVWVMNLNLLPQIGTMALSVGTGGEPIWLTNGVAAPPTTLLGRPIVWTEKVPEAGNLGDINLVDMSYYLVGDRRSMQIDVSPHPRFAQDQTSLRVIQRCDGRPWLQSAITPQTGTTTLSAFVNLSGTRT